MDAVIHLRTYAPLGFTILFWVFRLISWHQNGLACVCMCVCALYMCICVRNTSCICVCMQQVQHRAIPLAYPHHTRISHTVHHYVPVPDPNAGTQYNNFWLWPFSIVDDHHGRWSFHQSQNDPRTVQTCFFYLYPNVNQIWICCFLSFILWNFPLFSHIIWQIQCI